MKQGFLLQSKKPDSSVTTPCPSSLCNAAQLAGSPAVQLAEAQADKAMEQQSIVAQHAQAVMCLNSSRLALMIHSDAVFYVCKGLDPGMARRCWIGAAQCLAARALRQRDSMRLKVELGFMNEMSMLLFDTPRVRLCEDYVANNKLSPCFLEGPFLESYLEYDQSDEIRPWICQLYRHFGAD